MSVSVSSASLRPHSAGRRDPALDAGPPILGGGGSGPRHGVPNARGSILGTERPHCTAQVDADCLCRLCFARPAAPGEGGGAQSLRLISLQRPFFGDCHHHLSGRQPPVLAFNTWQQVPWAGWFGMRLPRPAKLYIFKGPCSRLRRTGTPRRRRALLLSAPTRNHLIRSQSEGVTPQL